MQHQLIKRYVHCCIAFRKSTSKKTLFNLKLTDTCKFKNKDNFGFVSHWPKFTIIFLLKNGPFPASFSLFSSFQYTVDSIQMFDINKFLPMTGLEPRTSGIGSDRSTNWATFTSQFTIIISFYCQRISLLKHTIIDFWKFHSFNLGRNV